VGNLLRDEGQLVLSAPGDGPVGDQLLGRGGVAVARDAWHVPPALEHLAQHWVVRLFGHRRLSACVVGTHVPSNHLHHSVSRVGEVGNPATNTQAMNSL
jgi:hypothetical protein